ncbi:hypothetical protein CYY_008958 [Polysphondylium violaceum]|uniref:Nucleosome assembly protein n=1 Tax=Polysphondylium violaceum TaxID=133409 RepID=A0A8J4PMK8_9MYCE|nr:hypothetical protein CYY_008958 [Polysphondylium violaceum]
MSHKIIAQEFKPIQENLLEKLNAINDKIQNYYTANKKKTMVIENEFNDKLAPHYKKRFELISKTKGLDDFWSSVISQAMISNFDTEDETFVKYLSNLDLSCSYDAEKEMSVRKLTFHFKSGNPLFTNTTLEKVLTNTAGEVKMTNSSITKNETKNNNNKNKKRKEAPRSFLLNFIESQEPEVSELFEEFCKMFEDPFTVLLENEEGDEEDDDDEISFDGEEDGDEGEEDEEEEDDE